MLVVTGIFENERFIPDRPVSIPQRRKVTVTIEEDRDTKLELERAVNVLYNDYINDKELTEFTCLDCEEFYEPR